MEIEVIYAAADEGTRIKEFLAMCQQLARISLAPISTHYSYGVHSALDTKNPVRPEDGRAGP